MSFTFRTTCQNSWVLRNHSKHPQTLNSTRRIWKKTSSTRIRGQRKEVYKHSTTCLQFCNLAHEILLWRVWLNISANYLQKGPQHLQQHLQGSAQHLQRLCKVDIRRTSTDICKGLSRHVSCKHLPQQHARWQKLLRQLSPCVTLTTRTSEEKFLINLCEDSRKAIGCLRKPPG